MPHYFFNIDDGQPQPDPEGVELDNLSVAKCEAVKLAGNMICDAAEQFWDRAEWTMTVTDERGLTLFVLNIVGTDAPVTQLIATPPRTSA